MTADIVPGHHFLRRTVNMKTPEKEIVLLQEGEKNLPPIALSQANYWKSMYFAAYKELVKANKGIRRLRAKLDRRK